MTGDAGRVSAGHGARSQRSRCRPEVPAWQRRPRTEQSASRGRGRAGRGVRDSRGREVTAGARRARQAWDRVVTCSGPVNAQPKGLLRHAYEIGGSTEVLAPVARGHIGQAEARVGLHTLTDPGLRGQETRLRRARGSPAGHGVAPVQTPQRGRPQVPAPRQEAGDPQGTNRAAPARKAAWRRRGGTSQRRAVVSQDAPSAPTAPTFHTPERGPGVRGWRAAHPPPARRQGLP